MVDKVIENLFTTLSFNFDEKKLEKFGELVESGVKGLTAIVGSATAAATAIFAFTKSVAESNDELGKLSQRIGVDVEALQELGFIAELNGGSIDSMNSSLSNLSRIVSEAARGTGAGVEAFGILGVSISDVNGNLKTADDLLLDVADSISMLDSQAEKLELAQKLGIGEDLLLSLQQGSKAIEQQRKEAKELGFVIDKDATQAAADFNDELLRVMKIISGISSAVGTRLIKQIEPMIEAFVEWFKINRKLIQQNISIFLERTVKNIKIVFAVASRVVGVILSLVDAMGGWKNAIIAVTGVLIAMNASALLMPALALGIGAGILLILEDFVKFAEGGDSVLGELANKSKTMEVLLKGLLKFFKMVRDGWVLIFTEGDKALEGFLLLLRNVGKSIQDFLLTPLNTAIGLINKIPGINLGAVGRAEARAVGGAGGIVNNQSSSANTTNNTTNRPTINVNINGGNPDEIKRVISGVLSEQYSGAKTTLESQVKY